MGQQLRKVTYIALIECSISMSILDQTACVCNLSTNHQCSCAHICTLAFYWYYCYHWLPLLILLSQVNAPHLGEWLSSPRAAHPKPQPFAGILSYDLSIGIWNLGIGCMNMNTWPFANKGVCVWTHLFTKKLYTTYRTRGRNQHAFTCIKGRISKSWLAYTRWFFGRFSWSHPSPFPHRPAFTSSSFMPFFSFSSRLSKNLFPWQIGMKVGGWGLRTSLLRLYMFVTTCEQESEREKRKGARCNIWQTYNRNWRERAEWANWV